MSELFRTPATGRDMTANGVTASEAASIPWTSPGACLWMRGATACFLSTPSRYVIRTLLQHHCGHHELTSGVTSFCANPVPPLVTTRLALSAPSVKPVMAF